MRTLALSMMALASTGTIQAQFAEPNSEGISFAHMHVVVADTVLHKQLWPDLFGAELVQREGYSAVRVANALIFLRPAEPTAPSVHTAIDHFGLTVRDLDRVLARWKELGYEAGAKQADLGGRASAFITMPGGIRLALREKPSQSTSTAMGHVHFSSRSAADLPAWYARYFGASLEAAGDETVASVPGSELRFQAVPDDRLPTRGTAIDHIGFEVRDWDAFIATIEAAGIPFEFGPTYIESLDLWVAFFNDPSGVLVEVTHGLDRF